jgi:hypothetical protein
VAFGVTTGDPGSMPAKTTAIDKNVSSRIFCTAAKLFDVPRFGF